MTNKIITEAIHLLSEVCKTHNVCPSHGTEHGIRVMKLVKHAMNYDNHHYSDEEKLACELAGLLHDADDRKFFKANSQNAQNIMTKLAPKLTNNVLFMINLVSTSANGNYVPPNIKPYQLYPRYADRIEAIGHIGIKRCLQFNIRKKIQLFNENTPKPETIHELQKIARMRFLKYNGHSDTMIDHYYDKLLCLPVETNNTYFDNLFKERIEVTIDFCMHYSKFGNIDYYIDKYIND